MEKYMNPIDELIYSTVKIKCLIKDGISYGTKYFFYFLYDENSGVPCIVTNKHVIENDEKIAIYLTLIDEKVNPKLNEHVLIDIDGFQNKCIKHPDKNIDLAIIPITPIILEAEKNVYFYYMPLNKNVVINSEMLESISKMEDVIMIGYPMPYQMKNIFTHN